MRIRRDRETCNASSAKYCTALWCRKHSRRTELLAQKRNIVRNRTLSSSSSSWTEENSKLTWCDSENKIPKGVNIRPKQILKVYTIENNGQDHIVNNDDPGGDSSSRHSRSSSISSLSDKSNPLDRYLMSYKGPTSNVRDITCDSALSYSTGYESSMDFSKQILPNSTGTLLNNMTNGFRNESTRQRQRIKEKWFDTQVAGF